MGLLIKAAAVKETCDVVISNVVVIDATRRIGKVSIGIRDGRISGVGRAGNPDMMDDVEVVVGTGTTIISGEGLIATAGAIDTHVHLLSPRIMEASLASGVTTIIGQEFGPVWGVGVNSPWALRHAFNSFDQWPVNIGFLGRGSSSERGAADRSLGRGRRMRLQGARRHGRPYTSARHRARTSPSSTTCRSRCTPMVSTSACRSTTRCTCSPAERSTPSTSKVVVAATCRTS